MKLTIKGMGMVTPPSPDEQCDTSALSDYLPPRKLRRMDHFTRMTLLAAHRALDDAQCLESLPANLGIVISTGYGPAQTTFDFLDSIIEDGAKLASPLAFSHSVHNIPAGVLSILLGTPCPQTTLCQLSSPVTTGLLTAAMWLAEGRVDTVLFGAVDETTPLLKENTARLSASSALPGEGAAFFLLNNDSDGYAELNLNPSQTDALLPAFVRPWGNVPIAAALNLGTAAKSISQTTDSFRIEEDLSTLVVSGVSRG